MNANRQWTLIFDFGEVLFDWSQPKPTSGLPVHLLKEFISSDTWRQYNCGLVNDKECYQKLASQFDITVQDVTGVLEKARSTITLNRDVWDFIKTFKAQHPGLFRTYAMSNVSATDWHLMQSLPGYSQEIFDKIFVSCDMRMCKPELRSYRYLLESTGTDPSWAIFIDNNSENVMAAQSLGLHGMTFTGLDTLRRELLNILGDSVQRGQFFLARNAKRLHSISENGLKVRENFTQLLIFEMTKDYSLIDLEPHKTRWNFFIGEQQLVPGAYPADMDTTCIALVVLPNNPVVAQVIMEEALQLTNPDGIFMTYFDSRRPRTDPMVCVNILRLFYVYGCGDDRALQPTKDWIRRTLLYRAYVSGTRYYASPETFLFYLSRLLMENPGSDISLDLGDLLQERLRERINSGGNAIELAMRILACKALQLTYNLEEDKRKLLGMQEEDGGWELSWICRTGKKGISIGNRGLATALAIQALA
ncbi:Haloacid dehalogenase-like hydrolase-domain-containing protein [Penicillium malachiteum]|uniref:Haloacid dehalogenase-like hydrolase-domain-containing protein n=1 Tax=Penicillium malachiteum TaxID=1324776 RepID=A0AAD6HGJ8_9EURO|nr:Haloacid dehalogenase-like hydrolase-domain-containing protein [Penicillium malachiteum]